MTIIPDPSPQDLLESYLYFPSAVYRIEKPEFLVAARQVSYEFLAHKKIQTDANELYPLVMTENFFNDERLEEFCAYLGSTAWTILAEQGINMQEFKMHFTEMWCQEHQKFSAMEQHIHANTQLVGFYFLDCPDKGSKVLLHDPRPGAMMTKMPEADKNQISYSSHMVAFDAKPGTLLFTNSWLPHSFTRNGSNEPTRFIHFNLSAHYSPDISTCVAPNAEVV